LPVGKKKILILWYGIIFGLDKLFYQIRKSEILVLASRVKLGHKHHPHNIEIVLNWYD
jgi:hypothetical protein